MTKRVPEIRFEDFTDDWEQRKLGDVGSVAMNRRIFKEQTTEKGDIPFYKIGTFGGKPDAFIPRALFEEYKSKYPYPEVGDILISASGSIGRTVEYTGKEEYFQDSNIVWVRHEGRIDNKFLKQFYSIVEWKGLEGSTIQRLYNKSILDTTINLPSIEEQKKIGIFFQQVDDTIALHQRKLEQLQSMKDGFLQKMFPIDGEKEPEIRFPGFTDDWEQRKLDNHVTLIIREVPKPNYPYERISVRSHAKGTFHQKVEDPSTVAMDKLFVVKENDLIVNITFAWEHAIAVANKSDDGLLVSHRFPTYRAEGKSDIDFIRYLVSQESFRRKLEFISPGGAGRNRVLNKKDFLELKVTTPLDINEQQEIGTFFKKIDSTIALHQRELELLKQTKKAFLQKMFV